MKSIAFYVRDRGTTIPVVALNLDPANEAQNRVLRRAGYGEPQSQYVMLLRIAGGGDVTPADTDPFKANERGTTLWCAHMWAREHFDRLEDGMNLDVESFREAVGRNDYAWLGLASPPLKTPDE